MNPLAAVLPLAAVAPAAAQEKVTGQRGSGEAERGRLGNRGGHKIEPVSQPSLP
jgi:hypothetical protein